MKLRIISILTILILFEFMTSCSKVSDPYSPDQSAKLNISLNFPGRYTAGHSALGSSLNSYLAKNINAVITKITIDVFDGTSSESIASADAVINIENRTFSAELDVPVGEERIVEVRIFESFAEASGVNLLDTNTWIGRESGVSIEPNITTNLEIDLYPLPVKGRRVVVQVSNGSGTQGSRGNPVEISISNLDNLRGVQFDLIYNRIILQPESVSVGQNLTNFRVDAEVLSTVIGGNGVYRIIVFSDNNASAEIPVVDKADNFEPLLIVNFQVLNTGGGSSQLLIDDINSVVTDSNYNLYQLFSIGGVFNVIN